MDRLLQFDADVLLLRDRGALPLLDPRSGASAEAFEAFAVSVVAAANAAHASGDLFEWGDDWPRVVRLARTYGWSAPGEAVPGDASVHVDASAAEGLAAALTAALAVTEPHKHVAAPGDLTANTKDRANLERFVAFCRAGGFDVC
jgi:hypothetical protein